MSFFCVSALKGSQLSTKCGRMRSSHQRCSIKKGVLRNFAKFTGKYLCQSLFLRKLQTSEISKNTFFTEHLQKAASETIY